MKIRNILFAVILCGCSVAGTLTDAVVTVAGDVCKLLSQDDPTEPQWATVACTVEGVVGSVVVTLPWASWTSANGQTSAQAKARAASRVKAFGNGAK